MEHDPLVNRAAEPLTEAEATAAAADPNQRNGLANIWTQRGIALLNENTPDSLAKSIPCFELAIELRSTLPLDENPWFRYGLTAGWMNRGDALTRLGSSENLAEAVCSYDRALELLRALPVVENPLFLRRHAIAWMNRGITLLQQNAPESVDEAVKSFGETIALSRHPSAAGDGEYRLIAACAWMNRGNAFLGATPPDPCPAREASREALVLTAGIEEENLIAAETGFKARHILCRAIVNLLSDKLATDIAPEDLLAEATDAVEEGMKLMRHWEQRGIIHFRVLANDLFRFGARVYQTRQPHFLPEFLLETLGAESSVTLPDNEEMHVCAIDALHAAISDVHAEGFKALNTPRYDRLMETLRELRSTEARLVELRQRSLTPR